MPTDIHLNITKDSVPGWKLKDALRELYTNALDAQPLDVASPYTKNTEKMTLTFATQEHLEPEHFIQAPNSAKLQDPKAHGGFGCGMKDALAVLQRHRVAFVAKSPRGTFTVKEVALFSSNVLCVVCDETQTLLHTEVELQFNERSQLDIIDDLRMPHLESPIFSDNTIQVFRNSNASSSTVYLRGFYPTRFPCPLSFSFNIVTIPKDVQDKLGRDRNNFSASMVRQELVRALQRLLSSPVHGGFLEQEIREAKRTTSSLPKFIADLVPEPVTVLTWAPGRSHSSKMSRGQKTQMTVAEEVKKAVVPLKTENDSLQSQIDFLTGESQVAIHVARS